MEQEIIIEIYGGHVQILPAATQATQNFYGNEFAERVADQKQEENPFQEERQQLARLIGPSRLDEFLDKIAQCATAAELGVVVVAMVGEDNSLTEQEMVKESFIKLLQPFAVNIRKGNGVDNLRYYINEAWAKKDKIRP